ncbi:hypothetical protein [Xenorhabdus miraniensis]|nr:hypothetical protein [Xenorhabdus miraniensis]
MVRQNNVIFPCRKKNSPLTALSLSISVITLMNDPVAYEDHLRAATTTLP